MGGLCGKKSEFKFLKKVLQKHFTDEDVGIIGRRSPSYTGNFEVTLANGEILHSKRRGDGHFYNDGKLSQLIGKIHEQVDKVKRHKHEPLQVPPINDHDGALAVNDGQD